MLWASFIPDPIPTYGAISTSCHCGRKRVRNGCGGEVRRRDHRRRSRLRPPLQARNHRPAGRLQLIMKCVLLRVMVACKTGPLCETVSSLIAVVFRLLLKSQGRLNATAVGLGSSALPKARSRSTRCRFRRRTSGFGELCPETRRAARVRALAEYCIASGVQP